MDEKRGVTVADVVNDMTDEVKAVWDALDQAIRDAQLAEND